MCLAQGPQRSDAGEAGTCSPSVSTFGVIKLLLIYGIYLYTQVGDFNRLIADLLYDS